MPCESKPLAGVGVLVLAAGCSTRIQPLSGGRPKPLLDIAGGAIIEHGLRWLADAGADPVWINLHYRPYDIISRLGGGRRFGLTIHYNWERTILGTAGAVGKLRGQWGATTLVVYGDNLMRFDLANFLDAHRRSGAAATIALFDPDRQPHTGIAGGRVQLDGDNRVVAFHEGGTSRHGLVNAGAYLLDARALRSIPEGCFCDFGKDVFPAMLERDERTHGHVIEGGFCLGLDTPESFERAQRLILDGEVSLT